MTLGRCGWRLYATVVAAIVHFRTTARLIVSVGRKSSERAERKTGLPEDVDAKLPVRYDGHHRMTISMPLHEVMGLALLYSSATEEQIGSLADVDGVNYGLSVSYAALRLSEALAELFDDMEMRLELAVQRAALDQLGAAS